MYESECVTQSLQSFRTKSCENNKPIGNALVEADAKNGVHADSDGSFAIVGLEPGKHRITAKTGVYWIAPAIIDCPAIASIRMRAFLLGRDSISSAEGIALQEDDVLSTLDIFRPPVEINIVAKTSATNLRMAYAADQVIFNWEVDNNYLRVDGGPANGQHKPGAGAIPPNEYVAIRWLVTQKRQAIFVNGVKRFEHFGDYSQIDRPISVFTHDSTVTVKSIKVLRLPSSTE